MKYVERNITGKIISVYANPQENANELLSNDNLDLIDFFNPPLTWEEEREAEYKSKGWFTIYDLVDDILDRGPTLVKLDRDEIKNRHPKGE